MKTPSEIEATAVRLAEKVMAGMGLELVHIKFLRAMGGWTLRVYIDGPEGVSVQDCAEASRELSASLDVEDIIPNRFNLEVSSPGLDRILSKPEHFQRFRGQTATVKTVGKIEGRRNFVGKIVECRDGTLHIEVEGNPFELPLERIEQANLKYNFEEIRKC